MRQADRKQAPKHNPKMHEAEQTQLKGAMDNSTVIAEDFNSPLSVMDGQDRMLARVQKTPIALSINLTKVLSIEQPIN